MKNKLNIILAVLWLLIALFFCWLLFSKLSNNSNPFSFNDDLSIGDINTLYKSYPFSTTTFEKFNVSTVSESVHFQPYEGSDYLVELYGNWNEKLEPEVIQEGKTLKIKTPAIKNFGIKSFGSRKIIIKVPESECSKLFDTGVSTVSGSIHTSEICYSNFNADTTSGSIHFDGTVDALKADSVSGSIHVNGACKNINVDSTSGSIHFDTDELLTGKSVFDSTSGSIHITIPEESGFEFEWDTVSGSVSNDFYRGKCGKSGSLINGDGNTQISANSVSGSIHLNKN